MNYPILFRSSEEGMLRSAEAGIPLCVPLICQFHEEKNYCIRRRNTNLFCIEYILSGTMHIVRNNQVFTAKPNDLCIIYGNEPQLFYAEEGKPISKLSICVHGEFITQILRAYKVSDVVFQGVDCKGYFLELLDYARDHGDYRGICMQTAITIQKILMAVWQSGQAKEEIPEHIVQIKELLLSKIYEDFNIDDLSEILHMSKSHIIKYFKRYYHCTPYQYFISQKLDLAKMLLSNTQASVKDISLKLSFTNEHYFSYFFHKKLGVTPTEYRNNFTHY